MFKNISFLFGAGVSLPSSLPKTKDITKEILSGKKYLTSFTIDNNKRKKNIERIVKFLKKIKKEVNNFYDREINYEDIYSIVEQIKTYNGNYDNPVVKPFVDKICPDIYEYLLSNKYSKNGSINELAGHSIDYINFVICSLLHKEISNKSQFSFILDLQEDSKIDNINFFTLNHDTILEKFLHENNISFTDGFCKYNKMLDKWKPELFNKKSKIKLLKIHGSINWFIYSYTEPTNSKSKKRHDFLAKEKVDSNQKEAYLNKHNLIKSSEKARLLIGTINKLYDYNAYIYDDLQNAFYNSLYKTNHLFVSGYSFGDKGINNRLINWMSSSNKRKITLADPNGLNEYARKALKREWKNWNDNNRVSIINESIKNISWNDIYKSLFS